MAHGLIEKTKDKVNYENLVETSQTNNFSTQTLAQTSRRGAGSLGNLRNGKM